MSYTLLYHTDIESDIPTYADWTECITSQSSLAEGEEGETSNSESGLGETLSCNSTRVETAESEVETTETDVPAEENTSTDTTLPPLVSPLLTSNAAVKPVERKNMAGSKEVCPKGICTYKRERRGRPWIQCNECEQWCHCRCVNLTKAEAETLSQWMCPLCK